MPSSRSAIGARILHGIATFSVVLLAGSTSPITDSSPAAAAQQELTVARATGRMLPRPVGLLPDSNYAIPDGALFVSPSGNDGWEGTEQRPLKSLTEAVDRVDPNGTIVMRAGNYPETVPVIRKPLKIQPYPHEAVWMKGSDVLTQWTPSGDDWRADGWVSPFCQTCFAPEAIDPAFPLAGLPEQVFIDGEPLRQVDTRWGVTSGTFFIDPATRNLYIGRDPADVRVEASSRWLALQLDPGAAGSVIRGIGFSDYAPHWNIDQLGAVIVNAPLVHLEGNAFVHIAGTALSVVNQPYVLVTGNVIASNGYRGMNMYMSHHSVVRQNRFESNNTERFRNSGCGGYCTVAGLKAVQMQDLVVDNNDFRGNWGTGFWCDLACTGTTITDNLVSGNFGSGIFFEVSSGAVIAGNFINDNAWDLASPTSSGIKIAGAENVIVFGNALVGNVRQLGVYDDPRSPDTHLYSRYIGLTWDTARVTVSANYFIPDEKTNDLLATNATATVAAPDMFAETQGNIVAEPDSQRFYWTTAEGVGQGYGSLAAFEQATGRDFGR